LNVFTTWQLSFQQLLSQTSEDSVAVKLLRLLAFFDNKDISEWIFIEFHRHPFSSKTSELLEWVNQFADSQQRWNKRLFKKNLVLLHDFCLLQSVAQDADEYSHASLHPLVKDWIQLQMGKSACQQYALMVSEILGGILQAFWESEHFQLPLHTKQYLALHMVAQEENNSEYLGINCAELHQDLLIEYTNNQSWLSKFFRRLGLHNKAEQLRVQVMETRKRVLGIEHLDTLRSIHDLALTYWDQGRWEEAEPLQVQVLETRKRVLGAEHPDTLTSMSSLALTYKDQGRWEEAEPLQVQVLETRKRVLGAEHPDTLTSMNNLAFTWEQHDRHLEALKLMEECVQLRNRILGNNHPDILSSRTALLKWQAENLRLIA
jgi:Tetratricopeptide repeat